MMIAEPIPIRPTNGMPVASRPAIATTTIAPAATTDVPAVALATRAEWLTLSPLGLLVEAKNVRGATSAAVAMSAIVVA